MALRSPATGRLVGGRGLLTALEFSAADDHGLSVPGERRHCAEGQVAAIAECMDAGGAHAAFGLVCHRRGPE